VGGEDDENGRETEDQTKEDEGNDLGRLADN